MSEASKATLNVAVGPPAAQTSVSKTVLYVALGSTPTTPERGRGRVYSRTGPNPS